MTTRLFLIASLVATCGAASTAQWPQWRGPNRDGVVLSSNVPAQWPAKPTRKWTQPVGEGYSSPVVANGRVFVHSRSGADEVVSAFDLTTGTPAWSARYPAPFSKSQYAGEMSAGPFSTPLVASGRLFTLGVTAILSSFDAATGALKWRKDYSQAVSTAKLFTGAAMSPLIHGGRLIVHVGDDSAGAFRAFDPETGAERWTLTGHGPGYASPVVTTAAGGAPQFVTLTDRAVVGVDVASGSLLWSLPFPDTWNENIVTPVFADGVLVISGTRQGTFGYRLEKSGPPTRLWHNTDLPMYLSSPVADGGFVYGLSSKKQGHVFCLDARTGQPRWAADGRFARNATLQSAGPNLVVLTTDGDLVVVKRSPDKYEEVRRFSVASSPTWAYPVLLGSDLLVRNADSIAMWSLQ
jgi:outer membrane protein assembly factor BamB